MGRLVTTFIAIATLALVVVTAQAHSAHAASTSACSQEAKRGSATVELKSDGLTRSAVLHLPAAPAGQHLALLIALHGFGSNGPAYEHDTDLDALSNADGFAVLYPSSYGDQWQISGPETDVQFIQALVAQVSSDACIDPTRIYATGVSNGAGMAARLACDASNLIAAVVSVAGGYRSLPPCHPSRPVSMLEIHGTADTTVPYAGSGPNHAGAALPFAFAWATRDDCDAEPTKANIAPHTVLYLWNGCAGGTVVEQMTLYGVGHGMPDAPSPAIRSPGPSTISGIAQTWRFLSPLTAPQ